MIYTAGNEDIAYIPFYDWNKILFHYYDTVVFNPNNVAENNRISITEKEQNMFKNTSKQGLLGLFAGVHDVNSLNPLFLSLNRDCFDEYNRINFLNSKNMLFDKSRVAQDNIDNFLTKFSDSYFLESYWTITKDFNIVRAFNNVEGFFNENLYFTFIENWANRDEIEQLDFSISFFQEDFLFEKKFFVVKYDVLSVPVSNLYRSNPISYLDIAFSNAKLSGSNKNLPKPTESYVNFWESKEDSNQSLSRFIRFCVYLPSNFDSYISNKTSQKYIDQFVLSYNDLNKFLGKVMYISKDKRANLDLRNNLDEQIVDMPKVAIVYDKDDYSYKLVPLVSKKLNRDSYDEDDYVETIYRTISVSGKSLYRTHSSESNILNLYQKNDTSYISSSINILPNLACFGNNRDMIDLIANNPGFVMIMFHDVDNLYQFVSFARSLVDSSDNLYFAIKIPESIIQPFHIIAYINNNEDEELNVDKFVADFLPMAIKCGKVKLSEKCKDDPDNIWIEVF